ncbi:MULTISPECIES: hypothetical protein [Clostridium]
MSTTIYYFSGTSNSLKIGFVFPVYYMGLPRLVTEFIKTLEVNPKTYI